MLKIKRQRKRHEQGQEVCEEISSRGPFLTEAEAFDGGWRRIVLKLDPLALRMRFARSRREWVVPYEDLLRFARMKEEQLRRKAKKKGT